MNDFYAIYVLRKQKLNLLKPNYTPMVRIQSLYYKSLPQETLTSSFLKDTLIYFQLFPQSVAGLV